jgi:hypothetical protein
MSIDVTFKPLAPTTVVGVAAAQASPQVQSLQQAGVISFRIRNITALAAVLGWGTSAANTVATAATAAAPQNAITLGGSATVGVGGVTVYLELPYNTFFIASAAATFEVTPGSGGVGG